MITTFNYLQTGYLVKESEESLDPSLAVKLWDYCNLRKCWRSCHALVSWHCVIVAEQKVEFDYWSGRLAGA